MTNCNLHKGQLLDHYCETCQDAICLSCRTEGPHSNSLHRTLPLVESAQMRIGHFMEYIIKTVHPLLLKAAQRVIDLSNTQKKLDDARKVIAKDIALEYESIYRRLTQRTNYIQTKLQTNIKFQQQYLNAVDDIAYSFDNVGKHPHKFLLLYGQFDSQLRYLYATPAPAVNQLYLYSSLPDIPHYIVSVYTKISTLDNYITRNIFINYLLVKCVTQHNEELKELRYQRLTDKKRVYRMFNEMNRKIYALKTDKICVFCGCAFSLVECNYACSQNKSYTSEGIYKDVVLPYIRGNKMHYWVTSRKTERVVPVLSLHPVLRAAGKKHFRGFLEDIKIVRCYVKEFYIYFGKRFEEAYVEVDGQRRGYCSQIGFMFVTTNRLKIDHLHAETLAELLAWQVEGQLTIKYLYMAAFLESPLRLYDKFVSYEYHLDKSKPIAPVSTKYKY